MVADGPPPLPLTLWGSVRVRDSVVPDGTIVSAWIDSKQYAQARTFTVEGESSYTMNIPGDDPSTPEVEGGLPNDEVCLKISDLPAMGSVRWQNGAVLRFDLVAPSLQPPGLYLPLVAHASN